MQPQRSPLVKFDDIPGCIPNASIPPDSDLALIAKNAVSELNDLSTSSLSSEPIWRDFLSFTGTYRTFTSTPTVLRIWNQLGEEKRRSKVTRKEEQPRIGCDANSNCWVDIDIHFTAQHGDLHESCAGTVSVMFDESDGQWRIWMLRTWLECFDGRGHPDVIDTKTVQNGVSDPTLNGASASEPDVYDAIIIGGGQAGLSTAGRLQALGVTYVVLESNASIGDNWKNRYDSMHWHTTKEYSNLPFGHTFPPETPKMLLRTDIATAYHAWAKTFAINVRTSSTVDGANWDGEKRQWTIHVKGGGNETLRAKNLVVAIGPGVTVPSYPHWATADQVKASGFKGTIMHSFDGYRNANDWAGKRGVVVGTANTAHDIAEDMANAGMETTMIQRGRTSVLPIEWAHVGMDRQYHVDKMPDVADREDFTYPNKIMRDMMNGFVWAAIKASPERFDALERVGFKVDRKSDTYANIYVRYGGHYLDTGASARIAKGEIKIKAMGVKGLTQEGLLLEDGSELGADLIILATGFDHDFRNQAEQILDKSVADTMDDYWGTDREGELRAHAKFAGHPNLYYMSGDTRICRFFSRFLALQIQADVLGQPFLPYLE